MTSIIDGNSLGGTAVIPRNPYIAGRALADARGFFGRTDIFRLVETVLSQSDQNAIVLFGQRRIGKTSVLLRLRHHLPSPPFRTIYFDLMDRARKPLPTVVYELAATIAAELGSPLPDEGDFVTSVDRFGDEFLPPLLQQLGAGVRPVILFDEFDVLDVAAEENLPETAAARAFFPFLRRLMEREPRLAFVFVVGRKAEDLSINVKATFKAARYQRISVLDDDSARQLVGLADREGSLRFTPEAVDRLLSLTARHPYFTQLMCQLLFDQAYTVYPGFTPTIDVDDVERAIAKTLEAGENIFEWVWDGLPPAERVIFSAVAEVTGANDVITEEELTAVLQRHGIRILIRELELAPKTLIEWEMLRRVSGGYGFLVDLMRRWVAMRKPLPKVKDELDRINPIADQQYHLGYTFYRLGNLAEAMAPLKAALQVNPNHLKARLLLGEALREQGQLDDAVKELEEAYRYDEDATRYTLVRALMVQGEEKERTDAEDAAVAAYERVLAISPRETLARERWQSLLTARGDRALKAGDYDGALEAYRTAGAEAKTVGVVAARRAKALEASSTEIARLVEREEWDKAADRYRQLIELDPDNSSRWTEALAGVERQALMARRYAEGLGAEQQYKLAEAQRAFADVVGLQPDYKDAADRVASVVRRVRNSTDIVGRPIVAAEEHAPGQPDGETLFSSTRVMTLFSFFALGSAIVYFGTRIDQPQPLSPLFAAMAGTAALLISRARTAAPVKQRNLVAAGIALAIAGHLAELLASPLGWPAWFSPESPLAVVTVAGYVCFIAAFAERRYLRASPILAPFVVVGLTLMRNPSEYAVSGYWQLLTAAIVASLAWMATEKWLASPTLSTALAAYGAGLPFLSMAATNYQLYLAPVRWSVELDAVAGLAALWLLAMSLWTHPRTETSGEDS